MSRIVPLCLLAVLPGCAGNREALVAYHRSGADAQLTQAARTDTYALYRQVEPDEAPPPDSRGRLQARAALDPGAAVGFARGEDGGLVAVAGKKTIPLPEGAYAWWQTGEVKSGAARACENAATNARQGVERIAWVIAKPFQAALLLGYFILRGFH